MSAGAFAGLEAGIHQARFKCLIGIARFTIFRRLALADAPVAGIGYAFTPPIAFEFWCELPLEEPLSAVSLPQALPLFPGLS
jgi:hypothetical protein